MELVGLDEIADLAGVSTPVVTTWWHQIADFPPPVKILKVGPVFDGASVRAWIVSRSETREPDRTGFYDVLAAERGDLPELAAKVHETVEKLRAEDTSSRRPGILLGKVQSGKTRAYLGIIARAFDVGYDVAVILTKGTKSLVKQTLSRVRQDYASFIAVDKLQVHDIMALPELTPYELEQKLVFIVKKEDDNLRRLLGAFAKSYPVLRSKRLLIIDDEADLASISFRKEDGAVKPGKLSRQIDDLREMVEDADFLQVTATPYSLYLQPDDDTLLADGTLFKPKRPRFTVILPTHGAYVGGEYYFESSEDAGSPAFHIYREVPPNEREALKSEDRRRLKIERILTEPRAEVLREAILTFLVGGVIRRWQERESGRHPPKYSLLFHTEQRRASHDWQEEVAAAIRKALQGEAQASTTLFSELCAKAWAGLLPSLQLTGAPLPAFETARAEAAKALVDGELMITTVNSDRDVEELLDENGQLKLRTPFNMFIGGQILDRGVTINGLIGFYYGRDPKRFQQDTVLQHSRMYGVRPPLDLAVTRFYAPLHVYQVLKKVHAFDAALRTAFESGAHDRGVYFIQKDTKERLIPCSPNKLLLSSVATIQPEKRLLPVNFQTVSKSTGRKAVERLDSRVEALAGGKRDEPVLIPLAQAIELLSAAYESLVFEDDTDDERRAYVAALEHLSRTSSDTEIRNSVWLIVATERRVTRYRAGGRFSNAPDTKQQADLARELARDIPALLMLRQEGAESDGWRDLPFWWPVIVTPRNAVTSIFVADTRQDDGDQVAD